MTTTCFILFSRSLFKALSTGSLIPFFLVYRTNSSRQGRKSRIFQFWSITFCNPVQGAVVRLFLDKDGTAIGKVSWEPARPQVKFLFNWLQLFPYPSCTVFPSLIKSSFTFFWREKQLNPRLNTRDSLIIHNQFFPFSMEIFCYAVCVLSLSLSLSFWLVFLIPTGSNYYKESMTLNHNSCTTCACKCSVILWYFQLVILRKNVIVRWRRNEAKCAICMKPLVILHLKKVPDVSLVNHWPRHHKTVIWTLPQKQICNRWLNNDSEAISSKSS